MIGWRVKQRGAFPTSFPGFPGINVFYTLYWLRIWRFYPIELSQSRVIILPLCLEVEARGWKTTSIHLTVSTAGAGFFYRNTHIYQPGQITGSCPGTNKKWNLGSTLCEVSAAAERVNTMKTKGMADSDQYCLNDSVWCRSRCATQSP